MPDTLNESLTREEHLTPGPPRSFGLLMTCFFVVVAGFSWWGGSSAWWQIWLPIAGVFAFLAWLCPGALGPLNYLWFRFGLLLHKAMSPVIMGLIFFGAFLPVGTLMRLFGHRPLHPGFDAEISSYWIARARDAQPGPMSKQY